MDGTEDRSGSGWRPQRYREPAIGTKDGNRRDESVLCHDVPWFYILCWLLCVLVPFLGRLFGVSFTGALASFNDKFVVQQQTTPLKNPDNMAP